MITHLFPLISINFTHIKFPHYFMNMKHHYITLQLLQIICSMQPTQNIFRQLMKYKTQTTKFQQIEATILQQIHSLKQKNVNTTIKQYLKKQLDIITKESYQTGVDKQYYRLLMERLNCDVDYLTVPAVQLYKSQVVIQSNMLYKLRGQSGGQSYSYLKLFKNNFLINNPIILPSHPQHIYTIITRFTLKSILSYLHMCLHYRQIIKLITTKDLYTKFILPTFSLIFQTNKNTIQTLWNHRGNIVLFENDEFSEFQANVQFAFKRKFWYELAYDLVVRVGEYKYVVRDVGVRDEEIVYGAWRRDVISEQQYCLLIDKTIVNASIQLAQTFTYKHQNNKSYPLQPPKIIPQQSSQEQFSTEQLIKQFSQCQLFLFLPPVLILELFTIGIITKHYKNSMIYKQNSTNLSQRSFYIVVKGQCVGSNGVVYRQGCYFNVGDLILYGGLQVDQQEGCDSVGVASDVSLIYSIDIRTLKFILGHFYPTITSIQKIPLTCPTLLQIQKTLKTLNIQISLWLQKSIIFNIDRSQDRSDDDSFSRTILLDGNAYKLSTDFWLRLIDVDLNFLLITTTKEN